MLVTPGAYLPNKDHVEGFSGRSIEVNTYPSCLTIVLQLTIGHIILAITFLKPRLLQSQHSQSQTHLHTLFSYAG